MARPGTAPPAQEEDPASGSAPRGGSRRWPPRLELGLGALAVAWSVLLGLRPIADNSFFTHLATGRILLDEGLPTADPYSYTAAGTEWVVQSWLASALYGAVDELAGGGGLRLLTALLTGVLGYLAWRSSRAGRTAAARFLAVAPPLAIGSSFWGPRPLLIGLVLFAVVLVAEEEDSTLAWPLALVGAVWVNVHGSWPLGLVLVAVSVLGRRLDGGDGAAGLRRGAFLAGGIVVGALVGLAGPVLLVFPLRLLGRSEELRAIVEWQSPSFHLDWARLFLVQVALGVVLVARRPSYRNAVLLVVFVAAALLGLRNVPLASLVLVPVVARGLEGVGGLSARRRSPLAAVLVVLALVFVAVGGKSRWDRGDWDLGNYPVAALEVAESRGLVADPDVRLLTEDTVGNLLELRHGPSARVFFDDRVDMYPSEVLEDYLELVAGGDGWREVLDRHEVDAVLWRSDSALASLLAAEGGWEVLHEDDDAVLVCRPGSAACADAGS